MNFPVFNLTVEGLGFVCLSETTEQSVCFVVSLLPPDTGCAARCNVFAAAETIHLHCHVTPTTHTSNPLPHEVRLQPGEIQPIMRVLLGTTETMMGELEVYW